MSIPNSFDPMGTLGGVVPWESSTLTGFGSLETDGLEVTDDPRQYFSENTATWKIFDSSRSTYWCTKDNTSSCFFKTRAAVCVRKIEVSTSRSSNVTDWILWALRDGVRVKQLASGTVSPASPNTVEVAGAPFADEYELCSGKGPSSIYQVGYISNFKIYGLAKK